MREILKLLIALPIEHGWMGALELALIGWSIDPTMNQSCCYCVNLFSVPLLQGSSVEWNWIIISSWKVLRLKSDHETHFTFNFLSLILTNVWLIPVWLITRKGKSPPITTPPQKSRKVSIVQRADFDDVCRKHDNLMGHTRSIHEIEHYIC